MIHFCDSLLWYVDLISVSFWNLYNPPTITNKHFQKHSIYIQRIFMKFYRIESFVMNKKRYATYDIYNYNRTYFQLTSNFDSLVIGRRSPATWHRSPQFRIRDLIILFRKCDGWCLWIKLSIDVTLFTVRPSPTPDALLYTRTWGSDDKRKKRSRTRRRKWEGKERKKKKKNRRTEVTPSYASWTLDNALTREYETRGTLRV